MPGRNNQKLSHQTKGIVLMLSAVPVMVATKWYFDSQIALGLLAAGLLGWGAVELGKE